MPDSFEFDPSPAATKPTHEYGTPVGSAGYQDQFLTEAVQELLASTVAYRQRGVTLAGGQGVLPTGCVLTQNTSHRAVLRGRVRRLVFVWCSARPSARCPQHHPERRVHQLPGQPGLVRRGERFHDLRY